MNPFDVRAGTPRERCAHDDLAFLGTGGPSRYFRCAACGAALILQGGRRWTLRPSHPA